jgi:phage terminase large subunit
MNVEIPKKLQFLFEPAHYKVVHGGRGSAKSWSFGRVLLVLASKYRLRVLCAREVQTSIKQSVHQLLKDQIVKMGLDRHFKVAFETLEHEIRGSNGSLFSFTGLSTLTVDTIKSFEGYDVCWVEEGQAISKRSWKILDPTIRKSAQESAWKRDAEIWVSYNPELETDPTHQMFIVNPPPDCISVEMNWRDNPWFPDILNQKRLHCLKANPDEYDNIWEGKCKPAVEGAIFFKQIQTAEANYMIRNVPHDPMLRVHVVLDLGWDDSLSVCLVQKHTSEIRIIEYLEFQNTDLPALSAELKRRNYNWGKVWPPHDGYSASLNSAGKSTADILEGLGWSVPVKEEIAIAGKEEGIRQTRMIFPRMYFDEGKCNAKKAPESVGDVKHTPLSHRLIECLKRYRRVIHKDGSAGSTVKNQFAHGADCIRYVALNADNMTNEGETPIIIPGTRRINTNPVAVSSGSWMAM